jgi:hypothetical protein
MTTREEYAEAAEWIDSFVENQRLAGWLPSDVVHSELAARVLRALAEGAVLCRQDTGMRSPIQYIPI